ncbi:MAG TPA: hypothetical protein VLX91_10290 [Candidatus Acidoferrales bacterium]|nr:hypothetical protein [Candidatus Acidoferrales bacterium]
MEVYLSLTKKEINFFGQFKKPYDIQIFLNEIPYDAKPGTSSPSGVIRERKANCFEGALFGAAALRMLGHKPLIVDMIADNDDDHVVAVFKYDNFYGAIAKSNTTILRFREPVYRTLRELVMSYFDFYINTIGEKTLRSYSNPVDLSRFDNRNWMTTEENLDFIGDYLSGIRHNKILTARQIRSLSRADAGLVKLCFSNAVEEGVYKPEEK